MVWGGSNMYIIVSFEVAETTQSSAILNALFHWYVVFLYVNVKSLFNNGEEADILHINLC